MIIYCFGDSITYGEYDSAHGGWVDRIKTEGMAQFVSRGESDFYVVNLGIGGETTRRMRSRLKPELEARLDCGARSLVMLAYGANDAAESGGSFLVGQKEYIENLSWAMDELRTLNCEICLLNLTPVAPAADRVRSRLGRLRSNAVIGLYNEALRELAQRKSVALIDVNGAFRKHDLKSLFVADGVHPNSEGHALISNLVREWLSRL